MPQHKFTLSMGGKARDIVESAGTPISGGNAVEVNFDFSDRMDRGDALRMLAEIEKRLISGAWPPA
ncbi:MAG: hypothetical protein WDA25_00985 [Paracoccaceae bacterium]